MKQQRIFSWLTSGFKKREKEKNSLLSSASLASSSVEGGWGLLLVKNSPANAGGVRDMSSIPGSGRSPGGGHGSPCQYPFLENPMDRGGWWATVHGTAELDKTEVT